MNLYHRLYRRLPWVHAAIMEQAHLYIWAYKSWHYGTLEPRVDDWALSPAMGLYARRANTHDRLRKLKAHT